MNGQEIKLILGTNIKNLRAHRSHSQADLAERADISITFLSNIERGLKFPKPAVLSQIADALEVEVYELFKTNNTPKTTANNSRKIISLLSKKMNKKVNQAMDDVFKQYLK